MLEILVVDGEPSTRVPLGHALRARGHRVATANDSAEALSRLDAQVFSLVLSTVEPPLIDGFQILRRVRHQSPETDVVLMAAAGNIADAITAMRERAVDYVIKPFDVGRMVTVVERIEEQRRLAAELDEGRTRRAGRPDTLLVGRSPRLALLRQQVAAIADSTAAVLLRGESGTGKELVARMIHEHSPRRGRPFVAVNCAAIPANLIEAELFGHERGAFTGAVRRRDGRFRAADGGTLFLDEIGDMAPELQPKILRVLQEGSFEPIGTNTPVRVDVRVISATNRDLKTAVAAGMFRDDLYYRIRVFDLHLPPLRERASDLPLLVGQFVAEFTPAGQPTPLLSPAAWAALEHYPFPGNIRELKHAIQHASILARGGDIELDHLPEEIRGEVDKGPLVPSRPLALMLEQYERECISRTLKLAEGERQRAATLLGISRKSLWKKMVRYQIR